MICSPSLPWFGIFTSSLDHFPGPPKYFSPLLDLSETSHACAPCTTSLCFLTCFSFYMSCLYKETHHSLVTKPWNLKSSSLLLTHTLIHFSSSLVISITFLHFNFIFYPSHCPFLYSHLYYLLLEFLQYPASKQISH